LYDTGAKPSASFEIPVISVGNLSVGGTGKTPMVEYLIRLLTPAMNVATLSRGYGRKTKGFRIASTTDSPTSIGDEPFQIYSKFKDKINVTVGEERALAIPNILDEFPDTQIILLDDAFQHRQVKPSFQILLSDFKKPFFKDYILPAGRLRESRKGASRADAMVFTKCPPDLTDDQRMHFESAIRKYTSAPVFFACIRYGYPVAVSTTEANLKQRAVLVTGIANANGLRTYVTGRYSLISHVSYRDHHVYTIADVKKIVDMANEHDAMVITTEKDAVKLSADPFRSELNAPIFYLPIEHEFLKNGRDFDEMVLAAATKALN
jgi:tetraacyldisaccharide 4'-kinase